MYFYEYILAVSLLRLVLQSPEYNRIAAYELYHSILYFPIINGKLSYFSHFLIFQTEYPSQQYLS